MDFFKYFFTQHIMMKSLRLEKDLKKIEDSIIKYVRNIFRLKKWIDDTKIIDIRNRFRLKKENEAIIDKT